jgi:hypothetical protein
MQGLAYEEGARLFRLALSVGRGELDEDAECRLLLGLGRALHLSADIAGCVEACVAAATLARGMGRADLLAEAALVPDAIGPTTSELTIRQLCSEALVALDPSHIALRARVTARFAEACVYVAWWKEHGLDDYDRAGLASAHALALAEQCGDPAALEAALRARRLACSGPEGLDERIRVAERMLALGRETADARTQLWLGSGRSTPRSSVVISRGWPGKWRRCRGACRTCAARTRDSNCSDAGLSWPRRTVGSAMR